MNRLFSRLVRTPAVCLLVVWLAACSNLPPAAEHLPIVFVHGNGDSAGQWLTTTWRFESNGWPRERLFAVDLPYPLARDQDPIPQPGRSSSDEHRQALADEVDNALRRSGASKVVLIGNSRGGNAIRNYVLNGGAGKVAYAVLGGTPNHGVWVDAKRLPESEFNGAGRFLTRLNQQNGPGGDEITAGPRWLTIRSVNDDKFAQADGVWIGAKGTPTHVTADGPMLKGAENVAIDGIDHRETSYGPAAFAQTYRFLTGVAPRTVVFEPESRIVLNGKVSGLGLNNENGTYANNLPLIGAQVDVYAVDPASGERLGVAVHRRQIGDDGRWGPFEASANTYYEFVIRRDGYAITHIYRSPFPRSSNLVTLRAERLSDSDKDAVALVVMLRPRGYFGVPRDVIRLDGRSPPPGIPTGTPGVASVRLKLGEPAGRTVVGEFNGERLAARAWPIADNHLVELELQ